MRLSPLLLLPVLAASTHAVAAPPQAFEEVVVDTTLEDSLFRESDLKLKGLSAWETVAFPVPRNWDLTTDPELHLQFAHSKTLAPSQSTLTVLVNDNQVASLTLDDVNADDGELVVSVPRHLLKPYNRLSFTVDQRTASTCIDAFDPSLWTRISNRSFLRWNYEPTEVQTDLAAFPYPLFDDRGYGPLEITLVGPDRMSTTTVEATARLAQGLGRIADYRGVKVQPPVYDARGARTPAVLIGLVPELPSLTELIGDPGLRAGEALIAMVPNPASPDLPVLVIAGTTVESLDAAVDALITEGHSQVLAGDRVVIYEKPSGTLVRSRREQVPVGSDDRFTFADVGVADTTVRGFYAPNAQIPLRFEGNTQVHRFGLEAVIHYAYAANLDNRLSTMEVRLNGVAIDSVVLDNANGADSVWHPLRVPSQVVTPHSELEVVFNLFPKEHTTCATHPDRTTWASVYSDSELHIPRDGVARVPDLALLQYDMWPFTLDGDGAAV
ncbi:MAG: cellulose biosynthesis cyclic di-GMP-binding regulatory protein BcsB, partial [Myxococcota bacterium]